MLGSQQSGLGHAARELDLRHGKARKIETLLALTKSSCTRRLLEVATGSGRIAHYFATHPTDRCKVDAVDVVDNCHTTDRYRCSIVTDTSIPFDDESFDVVLSNHVIEQGGGAEDQRLYRCWHDAEAPRREA